jgi:radical SAM superfamily enzyme YgiQ (UPF0313 family)
MKICICTTPIRPYPTDFPPFGSMAIIQSLRGIGEDVSFYNIDYFRPSREEVETYFREQQFDLVGISAVVSTAYAYTKELSQTIRRVSPQTTVVVGGNLAASAEILLRKCAVDYCVIGDGEFIVRDLVRALAHAPVPDETRHGIKGICFLDSQHNFHFTGYGHAPTPEELEYPDFGILEEDGSVWHFVSDKVTAQAFIDPAEVEPGKRIVCVQMHKGCVARCTFCHRFERGFRALPVERTLAHVQHLVEKYNVGYIQVADENFGSDKKAAAAIAEGLGRMGLKWQVAGVRTRTVTKEALQHWKDHGCMTVIYGIESGSQKMLDVMEKNATVENNVNALQWTGEVGLNTVIQLVLGLPGEDDTTIAETIEFLKTVSPHIRQWQGKVASSLISINYAQALPGTPLYEYAREHGVIGNSIDEEEEYLLAISDTDAYKEDHFLNHSSLPLLRVLTWRPRISARLDAHHARQIGGRPMSLAAIAAYYAGVVRQKLLGKVRKAGAFPEREFVRDSGYFNIHSGLKFGPLLMNRTTAPLFDSALAVATAMRTARSPWQGLRMLYEYVSWNWQHAAPAEARGKSLRKTVTILPTSSRAADADGMMSLRAGR